MKSSNRILASLNEGDKAAIFARVCRVDMPRGLVLAETRSPAEYAYFPEAGVSSMALVSHEGRLVEVGMFGSEGFSLPNLTAGDTLSPFTVTVLADGHGHRVKSSELIAALSESFTLRMRVYSYVQAINVQIAYNSLNNSTSTIDRRLARWLLMVHDRLGGDDIHITQSALSDLLHVRRQSITTSLQCLEGLRLVRAERGYVVIRSRDALEQFAGSAYGSVEAEYKRLMGEAFGPHPYDRARPQGPS